MNRRERRAAKSERRKRGELPPEYYETAEAMGVALEVWKEHHPTARPHFALPPTEVGIIGAPLQVPQICKNDFAREIVDLMDFVGRELSHDGRVNLPTIMMLQAALEHCGYDIERVSLGELGLTTGGRGN